MGKGRAVKKVAKRARRQVKPLRRSLDGKPAVGEPRVKDRGESLHNCNPSGRKKGRAPGASGDSMYAQLQRRQVADLQKRIDPSRVETYADPAYHLDIMVDSFGLMLRNLIEASGMTQANFAEKARISASFVSNVIAGDRTAPPDKHEEWADILGLQGRIRERFLDLAMLSHLPKEVRPRFKDLLRRLERLENDA